MIAVTGSTGHIGNCLIRKLLQIGGRVKAVIFPGESTVSLEGLDVEKVTADIRNAAEVENAFRGVEYVYHLAGLISIMPGMKERVYGTNVTGTENVVKACVKNHVKRLLYTSSIHAYTEPAGEGIIYENTPVDERMAKGSYGKSKAAATRTVLDSGKEIERVVCCPSGVIGPYDYGISKMGRIILNYSKGKYKIFTNGNYDFVDVRDVADGLISAMKKGRNGEIYNLGCEKISLKKITEILSEITGIKKPDFFLPIKILYPISPVTTFYYYFTGKQPILTPYAIHTLDTKYGFSYEKAKTELGYVPMKLEKSIEDSYNWFRENGFLNK